MTATINKVGGPLGKEDTEAVQSLVAAYSQFLDTAGKEIGAATDAAYGSGLLFGMMAGAGGKAVLGKALDVRSANPTSRAFTDRLADYQQNPGRWKPESIHAEAGMSRRARGGSSEQIIYRNTETGETLVRHRVTNSQGKVIDDHFRPDYKPRADEVDP